ncbi:MAG: hypothetical protein IT243_10445 [Bacteroidia bacterium]|nr:hypothetical protein [Bacteroidia bacterium]
MAANSVFSQSFKTKKYKIILPYTSEVLLESEYKVDKYSIKLYYGKNKKFNKFRFNPYDGKLKIDSLIDDSLILTYRLYPIVFSGKFLHRNTTLIEKKIPQNPFLNNYNDYSEASKNRGLKTNGNISRGLSAGNRQDMVVNSNLNLKLNGKIADDISISGVISDDNNPMQPEGNTQQLQDFDKVFIHLSKDSNNMIIGDFEMLRPGSYFMNYNKKSRGLHFDYKKNKINKSFFINTDAAISRGRFSRNIFQGIEGNQGPYRLKGSNGETFIIIISGTEAVYIDGKKLSRGESNDYVINYNTGEITFMPSVMITRFSRIVAEFQYSDRNYQRSVLKSGIGWNIKNISLEINYFTEQDNKNQNFQQSLDGFDSSRNLSAKQILAFAGDNTDTAFIPRINTIKTFDNTKLLYRKTDSLGFNNIYIFTQNPVSDSVFYEVIFSHVGQGNGNYRIKSSAANGRVYEWVAPIGNLKSGNYEPVEVLIAPKRYQMLTLSLRNNFKNTKTFVEGVFTNNNLNTFSEKDKSNDDGYGFTAGIDNTVVSKKNKNISFQNSFKTEIISKNFIYLERYRNVEFERKWNRRLDIPENAIQSKLPEIISDYSFTFKLSKKLKFDYNVGQYFRNTQLNGINNKISTVVDFNKNKIDAFAEIMKNSITINNEKFTNNLKNYSIETKRTFKPGDIGVGYKSEKSIFTKSNDSIASGTFNYNFTHIFFENNKSEKLKYLIDLENRYDYLPLYNKLKLSSVSNEIKLKMQYLNKNGQSFNFNFNHRIFDNKDTVLSKAKSENNSLGRIESSLNFFKKLLKMNIFYQIGTVQEQKREFVYYKVADGNGFYIWNDYDSNKLQSLNEFENASDLDRKRANYIKTWLPVEGFIKSRNIQYNQVVSYNFPQYKSDNFKIMKYLSKLSASSAMRTDRKTTSENTIYYINPFSIYPNDSLLISNNTFLRNSIYINRNGHKWSVEFNNTRSSSKNLLVNGYENLKSNEFNINSRLNFNRNYGFTLKLDNGIKSYYSQILITRNYKYNYMSAEPQIQYTSNKSNVAYSLIGKYYKANADSIYCRNIEMGTELRLSKASKGMVTGNFKFIIIDFNGENSSPLGYELMKGLLAGNNFTWNMIYMQRISQNIQLEISYDGRKSQNSPFIHIGRLMARYLF